MNTPFADWDADRLAAELASGHFLLQYQPKVDLHTARIVGAEALVRHVDAAGRRTPPSEFIRAFEANGFIDRLTHWVCEQAIGFLPRLLEHAGEGFRLSFNIAPDDLGEGRFLDHLMAFLKGQEYLALHLTLELTETTLIEIPECVQDKLAHLRDIGFGISMDDFGTGYSSMERLSSIPFTEVKIDRGFVRRIGQSQTSAKVIDAAVAMAHYLNLTSVAEGIESQEQIEFLRNIGCEQGQGYIYSAPLDGDTLIDCIDIHFNGRHLPVGFVSQAVLDHIRWHRNFVCNIQQLHRARREGRQPRLYFPLSEFDPEECRLGRWLRHQHRELERMLSFSMLDKPHRDLHQFAESLWRSVVKGCSDDWLQKQLHVLGEMSHQLVRALYELEYTAFSRQRA